MYIIYLLLFEINVKSWIVVSYMEENEGKFSFAG